MEINLVVVNIGNSRIALGSFVAGQLQYVIRIGIDEQANWAGRLGEAFTQIRGREHAAIVGASVNPAAAEEFGQIARQVTGIDVEWVGKDLDVPIQVLTDNPQETGIDRVLGIAAAYEQIQRACVVVDAGTAVTVNACNDKGEFLGGAIAPGAEMMLASLHERTARLPLVTLEAPERVFGQNTEQAIRQGVFHGVRGMVRELVERYATELGYWPEVIATGGDAARLFDGWEVVNAISPDLVLYGVALAYANHHIKHDT